MVYGLAGLRRALKSWALKMVGLTLLGGALWSLCWDCGGTLGWKDVKTSSFRQVQTKECVYVFKTSELAEKR